MRKLITSLILFNGLICYGQERNIQPLASKDEGYMPSNTSVKQLKDVVKQIQEAYKVNLLFETKFEALTTTYRISGEKDLEGVLRELLAPMMLTSVKLNDKSYVIKSAQVSSYVPSRPATQPDAVERYSNSIEGYSNNIPPVEVSGSIVDQDGKPVTGATIIVKGTKIATLTDNAGNFSIKIPEELEPVLMISHIEMNMQEINVKSKSYIRVSMKKSERMGGEVVVVGYGKQLKRDVVTSVSTIKAEEIMQENQVNIGNALQGKVNGAIIVSTSGTPGRDKPRIVIRGGNPNDKNQQPLIVVDGVPRYSDLMKASSGLILNGLTIDDINPDEVESVSILKDNAATALYGTRGAFGVVLITTKRGKIGKPQFNFSTSYAVDQPTRVPKMFDAYQYALTQNEAKRNEGVAAPYNDSVLNVIRYQLDPSNWGNTNLYDVLVQRAASQQSNSLSVSGGSADVRYYINGSATTQKGLIEAYDLKRYTIQSNVDVKVSRDIKLALNTGFRTSIINGANVTGDGAFGKIFVGSPLVPIHNQDGSLYGVSFGGNNWANTIPSLSGYQLNRSNNVTVQANFEYSPALITGLTFRVNNSINFNAADFKWYTKYYDTYVPDKSSPTGYRKTGGQGYLGKTNNLNQRMGNAIFYNTDFGLDYSRAFGKHRVGLTGLGTHYYGNEVTTQVYREGLVGNLEGIATGSTLNQTINGTESESGKVGGVARVNYDYASKYTMEYSMRADASDNFPKANRWGYFFGGALGWRISEEKFIKQNLRFVQDMKIRTSMGLTGIDNLDAFNYFYTYNIANASPNGGYGGYIIGGTYQPSFILNNSNVPNPNVTWGKSLMRNIGLDFSLWKGALSGTFDVFDKNLYDLSRAKETSIPATYGIGAPKFNFAKEHYFGYDFSLSNNLKLGKDMGLTTSVNFSYTRSRVRDYGEPTTDPAYKRKEGHNITSRTYYKAIGIFQTQEEINNYPVIQDAIGNNNAIKPGDIKYADLDGDNKITEADQVVYENVGFPPFSGGLNLTFRYRTFSINAFFQGAGMFKQYYIPSIYTEYGYDNAWRPGNESAIYPRITTFSKNNNRLNTIFLRDGDYLRFKNLRFAYNLPGRLLRSTGLSNVGISASVLNLMAFSKAKDTDPEVTGDANNGAYYPVQRNYSIGLNIGL